MAVAGEALFLKTVDEDGTVQKEPVDLAVYQNAGVLVACDVSPGPETALFVRLAIDLDDGEAMALAIAESRGFALATDDRKAMLVAQRRQVRILTTADILKEWAEAASVDAPELAAALQRVETLARFTPPQGYPLHDWWQAAVSGQQQ